MCRDLRDPINWLQKSHWAAGLSGLPVKTTGYQTGTELRGQCEDRGDLQYRGDLQDSETRQSGQERTERESRTSSACRARTVPRYCELRIYLDRTRGDRGDKPTLFWCLWLSSCPVWMKRVLRWSSEFSQREKLELRWCTVVFFCLISCENISSPDIFVLNV